MYCKETNTRTVYVKPHLWKYFSTSSRTDCPLARTLRHEEDYVGLIDIEIHRVKFTDHLGGFINERNFKCSQVLQDWTKRIMKTDEPIPVHVCFDYNTMEADIVRRKNGEEES